MRRRYRGDETAQRLLHWSGSHKAAERLAGHILSAEGFVSIDPTHALGGPDGLADLICARAGDRWVAAAYFANGEKAFGAVRRKFKHDLPKSERGNLSASGFVFITNQYLRKADREQLVRDGAPLAVEVLHLERISRILDSPTNYGTRLEFLDVEMTKEEQAPSSVRWLASGLRAELGKLAELASGPGLTGQIPAADLESFREAVHSLVGYPDALFVMSSPMDRLRPPIRELEEYGAKVRELTGDSNLFVAGGPVDRLRPPFRELEEYEQRLRKLTGDASWFGGGGLVDRLQPPLRQLEEYEQQLDRVLAKVNRLQHDERKGEG